MQPTREQVIQWARDADLIDFRDENDDPHVKQMVDMLMHATVEAYAAGRAQGLKEAVDSCINVAHKQSTLGRAFAASDCVRSIEQLKGKQ